MIEKLEENARTPGRLVRVAGCGDWLPGGGGGEDGYPDPVLQAEFGEDAADVGLDGLLADRELAGDLPVAVALRDEVEYVAFARRQRL